MRLEIKIEAIVFLGRIIGVVGHAEGLFLNPASSDLRVMDCTAWVWLDAILDQQGKMRFWADSDSEVTRREGRVEVVESKEEEGKIERRREEEDKKERVGVLAIDGEGLTMGFKNCYGGGGGGGGGSGGCDGCGFFKEREEGDEGWVTEASYGALRWGKVEQKRLVGIWIFPVCMSPRLAHGLVPNALNGLLFDLSPFDVDLKMRALLLHMTQQGAIIAIVPKVLLDGNPACLISRSLIALSKLLTFVSPKDFAIVNEILISMVTGLISLP
ncbi:hypothetical protein Tsubulata_023672 [Turnera subulata]|uniref:Uncharacterized protein n=1 Tax=Turnera subulata TaxID=218843 RepID=A0A9Q0JHB9_9ROSI|nr:hypothetical protein Tsubulata_023672 [Turnera subulata]